MSKIKCFNYHEYGHYATKCSHNKYTKKPSRGVVVEALASQLELDFMIIACLVSLVMGSVWYLDYFSSFHMTGCKDFFSSLEEKDLHMHIEMGNDGRYNSIGIIIVTFEKEKESPLHLKDVMFVPGLKKNPTFVLVLEDRVYGIFFRDT